MHKMIISFALTLAVALPAISAERQPVVPIGRKQIATAIRRALQQSPLEALEFNEDQIDSPEVQSFSASPQLQATNLSYDPKSKLLESRLRCARGGCLPFYAKVTATTFTKALARQSLRVSTHSGFSDPVASPVLLKAGQSATLAVTTPAIRISLPVQCLQSGALGQTVRVRDPQTRRLFLARIESKTRLALVGELQ